MKSKLLTGIIALILFSASAAIIFFTDKPNATPVDSDFFALQRNRDYINSSVGQAKAWFLTSPLFTGTSTASGNLVVNGILYGNGGGLTNIGGLNFLPITNGNGTNESFWGVTFFQEVDALNFYPTNLFTGFTNDVLYTDGNGILKGEAGPAAGTFGDGTHVAVVTVDAHGVVTTVANTAITGAAPTGAAGGVLNGNYPNPGFNYSTVTNGMAALTTVSNNFQVDITHAFVASNATASAVASFDSKNQLTNAQLGAEFTFSANKLSITPGASPTLNLVNSTNLIYRYTTNAVTTIVMTFGQGFMTNVSTANITFTAINAQDLAALETCVLFATNSSGSDHTITLPNGIGSPGLGLPPVITVTNKQSCWIYVQHYGNQATNCWFIPSY